MLIFFFFFKNLKIKFFHKVFLVSLLRWRLTLTSLIVSSSDYSLDLLLGICQQILWWQCCLKMEHVLQKKYNFPFYDSCTKKWDNIPVSIDIVGHIKYVMPHILFGSPKKIWFDFIINYQKDTYCLFFCLARDPSAQREGASILNRTIKCSSSAASPL